MTLSSATNKWTYTGNGTTATYSYTKKIFVDADLTLTVKDSDGNETTLTITTDYTVTGAGSVDGGTIVLVDDSQDWIDDSGYLDSGWALVIRRVRSIVQETDIRNGGAFYREAIEDEFDKQIMIDQQQQEEIDRSIKIPVTSDATVTLPAPEDGSVIVWDGDDGVMVNQTYSTTALTAAVTAAELAKTGAETAETNAETAETNAETAQGLAEDAQAAAEAAAATFTKASQAQAEAGTDNTTYMTPLRTFQSIMSLVYPIGSVVTLGVSTNPNTLFGVGTWTAIEGKVIVGKASAGTFNTLDATGGAETHTLTGQESGIQEHLHNFDTYYGSGGSNRPLLSDGNNGSDYDTDNTGDTNAASAHNNLQPYIVKYVWQRTA